jgi:hypothetical protein
MTDGATGALILSPPREHGASAGVSAKCSRLSWFEWRKDRAARHYCLDALGECLAISGTILQNPRTTDATLGATLVRQTFDYRPSTAIRVDYRTSTPRLRLPSPERDTVSGKSASRLDRCLQGNETKGASHEDCINHDMHAMSMGCYRRHCNNQGLSIQKASRMTSSCITLIEPQVPSYGRLDFSFFLRVPCGEPCPWSSGAQRSICTPRPLAGSAVSVSSGGVDSPFTPADCTCGESVCVFRALQQGQKG